VTNVYGTLDELKARAAVTGTGQDSSLWLALHGASRGIDDYCNRRFFVLRATRLFDISDPAGFPVPDLTSITALREDADRDRVFEVTREASDYFLYPLNAEPQTLWGRPYGKVAADPEGPLPAFTVGRSAVQIDGEWGYRAVFADTGADVSGTFSASVTLITVTSGAAFAPGQTVRVGAEQIFIRQVSANDLTVVRGVNGTQAASLANGTDIYVYRPPAQVVESALLLGARFWKRKDSPYGPAAGVPGLGAIRVVPGLDPDIELTLSPFRRMPVGAGV